MNPLNGIDPREGCGKDCFNAVIEIPLGGFNKYEIDKKTDLLRLDRVAASVHRLCLAQSMEEGMMLALHEFRKRTKGPL